MEFDKSLSSLDFSPPIFIHGKRGTITLPRVRRNEDPMKGFIFFSDHKDMCRLNNLFNSPDLFNFFFGLTDLFKFILSLLMIFYFNGQTIKNKVDLTTIIC